MRATKKQTNQKWDTVRMEDRKTEKQRERERALTCLDVLLGAYRGVSLSCLSRLSQDSEAQSFSCCCSKRDRSGGLPEAEPEAGRDMRVAASKKLARMPCFPPSTLLHTSRFSVGTLSNALVGWWVGGMETV